MVSDDQQKSEIILAYDVALMLRERNLDATQCVCVLGLALGIAMEDQEKSDGDLSSLAEGVCSVAQLSFRMIRHGQKGVK